MSSALDASAPPFVPTLERARAASLPLPEGEPTTQERWAALVVLVRILHRRSWRDEIHQDRARVAHIPRSAPPPPSGFVPASHVFVEDILEEGTCPECKTTPGWRRCRVCGGSGKTARLTPCSCAGGHVACPACGGSAKGNRVLLRYVQDQPKHLRELYLPSHLPVQPALFGLESALEQAADIALDPPEDLRCHDLTGRTAGSAYRGGERYVRPTFHGHDYGDTIERAIEGMRAFGAGGQVLLHEVRAFAWPLLRLRYASAGGLDREVVIYFDRGGELRIHR